MHTTGRRIFKFFDGLLLLSMLLSMLGTPMAASAAGGSYSLNFAAADPEDYIPPVPYPSNVTAIVGRGNGDAEIPSAWFTMPGGADTKVESLTPDDMALGQVVPFEIRISVTGSTSPENGMISFVAGWNIDTSSNDPFGYDEGYGVIAAFIDTGDGSFIDPEGDATVSGFTWAVVGDEIQGTFTVSGLDQGDMVVLEAWLVLDDTIPAKATGNVPSRLISARTATGDTISTGNQTVPLLQVGDFFNADVDISVAKTDSPDPIVAGNQLTYTLVVSNAGPNIANGVFVTDTLDANTTFVSATGATCTHAAGVVTCDLGAVVPGAPVTITITVSVSAAAPTGITTGEAAVTGTCTVGGADLCNRVTVTTISDDTNTTNNSDSEPTNVLPIPPEFNVTKTANPTSLPEPGDNVTFTVRVDNTGTVPFTLAALNDSVYGDLNGQGTCTVPQTIAVGGFYECSFTKAVTGEPSVHTNVVTATVGGMTDTDDATVTITNVPPTVDLTKSVTPASIPEPGGVFTYTLTIENTSFEAVTISALTDTNALSQECQALIGTSLAAGATTSCTYTVSQSVVGSYANTANVTVTDNDGSTANDTDSQTVAITPVDRTITVTKTADPTSVPETGGNVTFTVVVNNTSPVAVSLDSLVDDQFGDLNGQGTCATGGTIAAGGTYTCSFTQFIAGNAGSTHTNTVTATADGAFDTDDATVTFTDVAPTVDLTKTANPLELLEPGGDFTFTLEIENTSAEAVTITALTDDNALSPECTALIGTSLAAGASTSCSYTVTHTEVGEYVNTASVTVTDNDGSTASDTDSATVKVTNVPPSVMLDKSAEPTTLPEPGGDFTYTLTITNNSSEMVTITAFSDANYALPSQCTGLIGTTLAAGASTSCSFTVAHHEAGSYPNTASVTVTDNDGDSDTDTDDETVTVTNVAPTIMVDKTAEPISLPEPGGMVTFTVVVTNNSSEAVTLTSLTDDIYGNLNGQGDCATGGTIAAGGSYICSFPGAVSGGPGTHTDTVTAVVTDNDGSTGTDYDDATVTITDVMPAIRVTKTASPTHVPETGGNATFTFLVENIGEEDVTLTSLTDTVFGDLDGQGDCDLPQSIAVDGSYTCSITKSLSSDSLTAHYNVTTATASDNDGNNATDDDDATVTFDDVAPQISITKTADPTSVPETGGDVTFTFVVSNDGVEDVTLTSLTDTKFGDLNGQGTCATGGLIAAGGSYSCSITVFLSSDSLTPHYNVVTAVGTDDDGTTDTATADETVTFTDVAPIIRVTKTAEPTSVPETGGDVTFTILVENIGVEDVTLTSLVDDKFGDLAGVGTCVLPQSILVGGSYSCSFTETLSSDTLTAHTNVVTANAVDDDNTPATDDDDETITFTDVAPTITVDKTAIPTSVPETGGNVTFTFTVTNTSSEMVTITSLNDSVYGMLEGSPTCTIGITLAAGGSCNFSITAWVAGDYSGPDHTNTFTAVAEDNEGTDASASDDETVDFSDVAPAITVTKSADPTHVPETGGDVTFTFLVENTGPEAVTLTELTDTVFGDLDGQGTCAVPQTIAVGGSYSCSITQFLASDSLTNHHNVTTATVVDDDNTPATDTDDETVTFDDVAPMVRITKSADPTSVPETGADVTFTFTVENIGQEDVTLTSLSDTVFGDLDGKGTCVLPQTILIGGSYSCGYTVFLASDTLTAHYNVSTATAVDDDNTKATDDDDETVTFTDVAPAIRMTKTADPTHVPETGGDVTFTFLVENIGVEDVTLTSLSDTVFGDLNGKGTCVLPQEILIGGSYSCVYTVNLASDSLTAHTNVSTATAVDDDGTPTTDDDDEIVTFDDVAPLVQITKTAAPTEVPETGAEVTFTFLVENIGVEDVTLTSLSDTVFGDLNGQGDCSVPQTILIGGQYSCSLTVFLSSDNLEAHTNVSTATVVDDDGTEDTDDDDETVTFEDVLPDITVTKTGDPLAVPETGGSVTFTFVVTNNSAEAATITGLTDDKFGDLTGDNDCQVGTVLAGGASCSFAATFNIPAGDYPGSHINTFTATGADNDGNSDSGSESETVDYTDVLPDIAITKTAAPTSVPETGGDVEFTIVVTNNSLEDATIDSLVDSDFDLAAHCPDAVGTVLGYHGTYTCIFTETISGDYSGPAHENTATVVASDGDGNTDEASDDETVTFTNVMPDISVTKTADQQQVFAPGEQVTFTFTVMNDGLEAVTISSLSDTVFGELVGNDTCQVGTVLAGGASCFFTHTALIAGDHENTFTAAASDNDGNSDTETATETVDMINPSIAIDKVTVDGTTEGDGLDVLTGEAITWKFTVTNDGDVDLSNITVTDSDLGNVCTIASLAAGESTTCTMTGTAITGSYSNTGTAEVSYTDLDGDTATRSAADDSSYFGADPQIAIVKTTTDGYNEGDTYGFLPGTAITWNYVVTNVGNVALSNVTVTDDKLGAVCTIASLAVGESITCTATGTVAAGWYNNIGTAEGSFTDDGGHTRTDTATDPSGYYGLTPGQITNSSLCDFGETFRLIFTPDMQRYTSSTPYYKLSDSNPGQFFYNLFAVNNGSTDTYTLEIPYPFVTQGAMPVHVYGGVMLDPMNPTVCFLPQTTLASYGSVFTLADYSDTNGDGKIGYGDVYLVNVPAEMGFQYINIHLDYGLEKTKGWLKKGSNVTGDDTVDPTVAGISILDNTAHTFKAYADGVLISGTTDTIFNLNEFKQIRGFGGLVYTDSGEVDEGNIVYEPLEGAQIQLLKADGTVIETMTTDSDGWYLSEYIHKGKSTTYTLRLVGTDQEVTVTVGGNIKYGEGNFFIPPLPEGTSIATIMTKP